MQLASNLPDSTVSKTPWKGLLNGLAQFKDTCKEKIRSDCGGREWQKAGPSWEGTLAAEYDSLYNKRSREVFIFQYM